MKCTCLLFLLFAAVFAEEKYTEENDDFDIEGLVADVDKLKVFYECFMDAGECDPVAADFKKDLPEVVKTACAKCTDKQKHITNIFLQGLEKKLPEQYKAFQNKYDAEKKYFGPLKAAIANF